MENPELPAENQNKENIKYIGTEKPETKNNEIYIGIPILTIAFAEVLIYSGRLKEAIWVHMILLMCLSLSVALIRNEEVRKTYQAMMLLPLLRVVNLSMPVFFDATLYSLVFIYAPLTVPVVITAVYQQLTLEELGITLRRIWLYFPLSILIGTGLGIMEYMIIQTEYLIPDLSILNLLKLTLVMVFCVGLVEEVIFRSILQTRLNKIFGAWKGILLSSIIFGFMHSGYGTFYAILYIFFVVVILGYMFHKTRSLPLVTLVHGFVNVFLFGVIPYLGPGLGLF